MARRRKKPAQLRGTVPSTLDIPIADEGAITETTVYPTIEAMFAEAVAKMPWFPQYSPGTQRTIKFSFYTAIAETLRTVAFRTNTDQNDSVFDDFARELAAYDAELKQAVKDAGSELH